MNQGTMKIELQTYDNYFMKMIFFKLFTVLKDL